ncbi:hypothetical protein SDC9_192916 [bioreactor metagenome]|uniref:Uncharacterized protein n=1 Tax=bioreactor metagenome TaxID=1076179 RepID=A0A645I4H3_9ZZZZ
MEGAAEEALAALAAEASVEVVREVPVDLEVLEEGALVEEVPQEIGRI